MVKKTSLKNIKLLIVLLILISSSPPIKAQDTDPNPAGGLLFGAKIGAVSGGFTHDYARFSVRKTGILGGLFVKYNITNFLGVSADALYAQEGGNEISPGYIYYSYSQSTTTGSFTKKPGDIIKVNSNVTLQNIELPISLSVNPIVKGDIIPSISLGASFDFILNATTRDLLADYQSYDQSQNGYRAHILSTRSKENVTSSFEYYNICPFIGAGLMIKGEKFSYIFDIRYKTGIRKINNLATLNIDNTSKNDFSYNSLMVSLGICFGGR